jgi:hypothetical protein
MEREGKQSVNPVTGKCPRCAGRYARLVRPSLSGAPCSSLATTFFQRLDSVPSPPAKGIVTRKGRDSGTEARGASASRARSARPRGFAPATRLHRMAQQRRQVSSRGRPCQRVACARRQGLVSQRQAPPRRRPGDGPAMARRRPAVDSPLGKSWHRNGKRHRVFGENIKRAYRCSGWCRS